MHALLFPVAVTLTAPEAVAPRLSDTVYKKVALPVFDALNTTEELLMIDA